MSDLVTTLDWEFRKFYAQRAVPGKNVAVTSLDLAKVAARVMRDFLPSALDGESESMGSFF